MASPARQRRLTAATANQQRLRGAYYTPGTLAAALAEWAVRPGTNRVLDPACGGGALLAAAQARMNDLRVKGLGGRLYGVELDANACLQTRKTLLLGPKQIRDGDFFSMTLTDVGGTRFDAVIGNPPYIRHHLLDADVKARAASQARAAGIKLNDRADAWAYFCAHTLRFLSETGRLALVLPGSILHADYALPLVHALGAGSGHSELIRLGERVFEGVLERTILLLHDRARNGVGEVEYREVDDVSALRTALAAEAAPAPRRRPITEPAQPADVRTRAKTRLGWHLTPAEREAWERLTALERVCELGDIASLRIGVVTGANSFFVRMPRDVERLEVRAVRVVARSGWLTGVRWTAEDDRLSAHRRSRLILVDPAAGLSTELQKEIDAAEQDGIDRRHHCSRREVWYVLADRDVPDLFLPYMSATAPGAVINDAGATCTNAIHRVALKNASDAEALAAGSWTTLARVSAEIFGRSYGGGVLKLELGEAARVRVPLISDPGPALAAIETVLADGGRQARASEARAAADRAVLEEGLGADPADIRLLAQAAERLERRRVSG